MARKFGFLKMEGIGNDFIVTHGIKSQASIDRIKRNAARLCDRRRGIGADGVMLLLPAPKTPMAADFRMRIFNSDGSEAEMCGNGIRCCALYAKTMKLSRKKTLSFATGAGIITTTILKNNLIRVDMGRPVLAAQQIPTSKASGTVINDELVVDGRRFAVTAVSMGNPHAVIFADALTDDLVHGFGKKIETHPFFPRKTNVEFITVRTDREIDMRVWERGCGETMACGTGACASVVAGILNKRHGNRVTVHLRGGDLLVEWDGRETSPVYMTGPAAITFTGNAELRDP